MSGAEGAVGAGRGGVSRCARRTAGTKAAGPLRDAGLVGAVRCGAPGSATPKAGAKAAGPPPDAGPVRPGVIAALRPATAAREVRPPQGAGPVRLDAPTTATDGIAPRTATPTRRAAPGGAPQGTGRTRRPRAGPSGLPHGRAFPRSHDSRAPMPALPTTVTPQGTDLTPSPKTAPSSPPSRTRVLPPPRRACVGAGPAGHGGAPRAQALYAVGGAAGGREGVRPWHVGEARQSRLGEGEAADGFVAAGPPRVGLACGQPPATLLLVDPPPGGRHRVRRASWHRNHHLSSDSPLPLEAP